MPCVLGGVYRYNVIIGDYVIGYKGYYSKNTAHA